jgi:hypothetical protein
MLEPYDVYQTRSGGNPPEPPPYGNRRLREMTPPDPNAQTDHNALDVVPHHPPDDTLTDGRRA